MKIANIILFLIVSLLVCSCNEKAHSEKKSKVNSNAVGKVVHDIDKKTWNVFQDEKENYWFGSNGNGIYLYDGKSLINYTTEDGLIDNTIRGFQADHLGNLYIETPAGISKYDGKTFTSLKIVEGNSEWKLEKNDLWFKCNGNPNDVYRYDGEFVYELKLPRQDLKKAFGKEVIGLGFKDMNSSPYSVFGLNIDKKGNLWIGTIVAGVFRFDGKDFLYIAEDELTTLPDGRVPGIRSILEDKDGYIWLSNFVSKYKINELDSKVNYEKLNGIDQSTGLFDESLPYFNSGVTLANQDLWMCSYGGGVWKYDGDTLINIQVKDNQTTVLPISIYKDRNDVLWLGTDNAGVFRFTGKTFEKFEPWKNK